MNSRIWAVVPAGGVGRRMNLAIPKQYLMLGDHPVIQHTLTRLAQLDQVDSLVVGISSSDSHWARLGYQHAKSAQIVPAGAERVDTVEHCLQAIVEQGGELDWALVHDAARPCVRVADMNRLISAALEAGQGAILAVPVSDTLKRAYSSTSGTSIECTVSRENLWRAMTPQIFRVGELLSSIRLARQAGIKITDEASAMEAAGLFPMLISGAADNIKITLPEDVVLAESILASQGEAAETACLQA